MFIESRCPCCGEPLAIYQHHIFQEREIIYKKYNVNNDTVSLGILKYNENLKADLIAIINKYTDINMLCCRSALISMVDTKLIKRQLNKDLSMK